METLSRTFPDNGFYSFRFRKRSWIQSMNEFIFEQHLMFHARNHVEFAAILMKQVCCHLRRSKHTCKLGEKACAGIFSETYNFPHFC